MDQSAAPSCCHALRDVLAANLRRLRHERGWSQETLAFEAGLHRTFIAHVERSARNISLDNIARLALALEVTAAQLLTSGVGQSDAHSHEGSGGDDF